MKICKFCCLVHTPFILLCTKYLSIDFMYMKICDCYKRMRFFLHKWSCSWHMVNFVVMYNMWCLLWHTLSGITSYQIYLMNETTKFTSHIVSWEKCAFCLRKITLAWFNLKQCDYKGQYLKPCLFNFVMQQNWWSSTRRFSQIWLQTRYDFFVKNHPFTYLAMC